MSLSIRSVTALPWIERPGRELVRLAWPITVSVVSFSLMTLTSTAFVAINRLPDDVPAGNALPGGGPHAHDFLVLFYVHRADGTVLIDGRPWTVTDSSSRGRCVALTCGRLPMCRNRTESGAEPKWNAPRKKTPSTLPHSGRQSRVTVASTSRHMPWSSRLTSSAVSRESDSVMRCRCTPPAS